MESTTTTVMNEAPPAASLATDRPCLALERVAVRDRIADATFIVRHDERVALLGRNGTGKTTLLRVAAGLHTPEEGSVQCKGPVGYVPQDYRSSLLPWFSVADNIALPLRAAGLSRYEITRRVHEASDVVRLSRDLLDRRPHRLSGGQQQLVALARALVGTPLTLLLDEPFSALDLPARVDVRSALAAHCSARRIAALMITHDIADASLFAHRVIVIDGTPSHVVREIAVERGEVAALERVVRECIAGSSAS